MAPKEYSFELKSSLSELDKLGRHLEMYGQKIGLSKKCLLEINLVLDELFTNIISYGFDDEALIEAVDPDATRFVPLESDTEIARAQADRRIADARTRSKAMVAEQIGGELASRLLALESRYEAAAVAEMEDRVGDQLQRRPRAGQRLGLATDHQRQAASIGALGAAGHAGIHIGHAGLGSAGGQLLGVDRVGGRVGAGAAQC